MAKLDARRVTAFLADPGAARLVLIFGEDTGLVRERGEVLSRAVAGDDPFRLVEVPREVAAKDAGLLAAEAATPALTGGRRLVRVRDATDGLANAAKAVLAGLGPGVVLLEAGSLDGRKGLRAALEKAGPEAAVIACYPESGAALEGSIASVLREYGVSAEPAALAWMAQRLGEDRLIMRRECEKVALYVGAGGQVTEEDALASLSEGSTLDLDAALLAATEGDAPRADRALDAAFAEGAAAVQVVRLAMRHVQRLEAASRAVARGAAPRDALDGLRPPIFFKSRPSFERALRLWGPEALAAAGAALLDAERATKTTGTPDTAVARAAVMGLAREAVRAKRGR
ncbi:DNA polymerase III subunit delta [Roseomonas terrae]|jgi:DNA polymerase-3 subunit delta|uniref:DNA-directed DNA polymerase n=1 Tax=Neoroseomonas terrae TaxID=424799 RepID=A0ABS5EDG8_9PROT|nr:DNA polymerase III subunit delta [Neoroseomonas terrae]MBR0649058.1 DNA polymerase III subunit delta [Neoroseomonas terrae]